MKPSHREIVLIAGGDIYINRQEPCTTFNDLLPLLEEKDILFGNLESALFDEELSPVGGRVDTLVAQQKMLKGLISAGFDVVSLANNHTTDFGPSGLVKTMNLLESNGIQYVGAGRNVAL